MSSLLSSLVFLIEQIAPGLYIVLSVFAVWTLRRYLRAQQSYRATAFELERSLARERRGGAITSLVLLVEAGLLVYGLANIVAPNVRPLVQIDEALIAPVDDGQLITPTPQPLTGGFQIDASGVVLGATDPASVIIATPTQTPTPVGTILPNAAPATGCDTDSARLQIPTNGLIVFEPITVVGMANTENFAFYRFELRGESTFNEWAIIGADGTQPRTEMSELGQFVPSFYVPGDYSFRLTVFDITNTLRATCEINIFISEPIPTPTPLGGTPAPGA